MGSPSNLKTIDRVGNRPCFDFVNTVHSRLDGDADEYLRNYTDLLEWAAVGGLLTSNESRRLAAAARSQPRLADRAFRRAMELRETLYRMFLALIRSEAPGTSDLASFNKWLAEALRHRRLVSSPGSYDWSWEDQTALDRPIWPLALSAAEVFTCEDHRRVKECPPPEGCGWIYLDTSRNGTRRWCNMRTCGNIAKARRYYQRHRETRRSKTNRRVPGSRTAS